MKKTSKRGIHGDQVALLRGSANKVARPLEAIVQLRAWLVHTRELLDGRDFLFSGPPSEIQQSLSVIVNTEHNLSSGLQCFFTRIDTYFLLRIQGPKDRQHDIASYFEVG